MRICIPHTMYKRPKVYHAFAAGINLLKKCFPFIEFIVIAVGSEGQKSRTLAESYGFRYYEYPNEPLNRKFQFRLEKSKEFNWDYCLFLGSDDIITPNLFSHYISLLAQKIDWIAPLDIYYIQDNRLYYSPGYPKDHYRNGESLGPGRMLSRKLLERVNFELWPDSALSVDRTAYKILLEATQPKERFFFYVKQSPGYLLDLKSEFNRSPPKNWAKYENLGNYKLTINPQLWEPISAIYMR